MESQAQRLSVASLSSDRDSCSLPKPLPGLISSDRWQPLGVSLDGGREPVPKLPISFTNPNAHPKTDTPEDPSQATVATTHTVTGTPFK
jgi:hypothetical protein